MSYIQKEIVQEIIKSVPKTDITYAVQKAIHGPAVSSCIFDIEYVPWDQELQIDFDEEYPWYVSGPSGNHLVEYNADRKCFLPPIVTAISIKESFHRIMSNPQPVLDQIDQAISSYPNMIDRRMFELIEGMAARHGKQYTKIDDKYKRRHTLCEALTEFDSDEDILIVPPEQAEMLGIQLVEGQSRYNIPGHNNVAFVFSDTSANDKCYKIRRFKDQPLGKIIIHTPIWALHKFERGNLSCDLVVFIDMGLAVTGRGNVFEQYYV